MQPLNQRVSCWIFLFTLAIYTPRVLADTLYVNCDSNKGLTGIQKAINILQQAGSEGSNTIFVSGSCNENVTIQSMDNLTLTARNGASITDPSNGNVDVLHISDSRRVSVNGFTINGGATGVNCANFSVCRFSGNTIQGASGIGARVGASQASFSGDVLQNNATHGLGIVNGGEVSADTVTVQGNGGNGIILNTKGTLILSNSIVQNNSSRGVFALNASSLRFLASTVTGNAGRGVDLSQSSQARFESFAGPNGVNNNGGAGVSLSDLSFAFFDAGSNVTGNLGGTDVLCLSQFSSTRGALTNISGGTTNCTEP